MENKEKEPFVPIHMRDFTGQIQQYLDKYPAMKKIYKEIPMRRYMWDVFSAIVAMHIIEYAVPQYKDFPDDKWTVWTIEDFIKQIQKYASRLLTNSRGEDEKYSDFIKIANYCAIAFIKGKNYEHLFVEPSAGTPTEDKPVKEGETPSASKLIATADKPVEEAKVE